MVFTYRIIKLRDITYMQDFTQLRYELIDHVAVLSMNNAPVNALSRTLSDEITSALDYISEIPEIRVHACCVHACCVHAL